MGLLIKKLFFNAIFNSCLFLLLFIGIQNSSNKSKVDFLMNETIEFPISFIVGSSFILGSVLGSLFVLNINDTVITLKPIQFIIFWVIINFSTNYTGVIELNSK